MQGAAASHREDDEGVIAEHASSACIKCRCSINLQRSGLWIRVGFSDLIFSGIAEGERSSVNTET